MITHNYSSGGDSTFSPVDVALLGTGRLVVVDQTAGQLLISALAGSFVSNFSDDVFVLDGRNGSA